MFSSEVGSSPLPVRAPPTCVPALPSSCGTAPPFARQRAAPTGPALCTSGPGSVLGSTSYPISAAKTSRQNLGPSSSKRIAQVGVSQRHAWAELLTFHSFPRPRQQMVQRRHA